MAKPKLALIPAAQGDKFYSVLPSDGVGDFTFARASTGTRIAPTGLIEEVASGKSRLNYDLLNGKVVNCPHYLLEPASTNLVTYSEEFSNSIWIKSNTSITANQIVSPDGTLNADLLTSSSGLSIHSVRNDTSQTATVGQNITLSVFAKKGTYSIIQLTAFAFGSIYANFDLENGIVGSYNSTNPSIENFGNGWYRCSFTATAVGTTNSEIQINIVENIQSIRNASFNAVGNETVYLWGAQSEQQSYPTSYIPTTSTVITRAAESANDSGDAATFNDSEGVLMVEASALADDGTFRNISISDGTTPNSIRIFQSNTSNALTFLFFLGNATQAVYTHIFNDITTSYKVAFQYKLNNFKVYVNGLNTYTDTSGSVFNPNTLNSLQFNSGAAGERFYGKTREVQYFDSVLTDAQLETLTSWTSLQEMITSQLYTNY